MQESYAEENCRRNACMPDLPEWLTAQSEWIHIRRGEQLICCRKPATLIYIVRSGHVNILSIGLNGQENVVSSVSTGGVIGEMEVLAGLPLSTFSARAAEDSTLIRLPGDAFLKWIREDPSACWQLVQVLVSKLYNASDQSSTNTNSPARERLMLQLVQHGEGRINMTRQELAEVCSVSPRTINRCVQRLKQDRLIGVERGKIVVSHRQMETMMRMINEREGNHV